MYLLFYHSNKSECWQKSKKSGVTTRNIFAYPRWAKHRKTVAHGFNMHFRTFSFYCSIDSRIRTMVFFFKIDILARCTYSLDDFYATCKKGTKTKLTGVAGQESWQVLLSREWTLDFAGGSFPEQMYRYSPAMKVPTSKLHHSMHSINTPDTANIENCPQCWRLSTVHPF